MPCQLKTRARRRRTESRRRMDKVRRSRFKDVVGCARGLAPPEKNCQHPQHNARDSLYLLLIRFAQSNDKIIEQQRDKPCNDDLRDQQRDARSLPVDCIGSESDFGQCDKGDEAREQKKRNSAWDERRAIRLKKVRAASFYEDKARDELNGYQGKPHKDWIQTITIRGK